MRYGYARVRTNDQDPGLQDDLREMISEAEAEVVISSTRNRTIIIPQAVPAYRLRNRIERSFNKLKPFRRIATRYDRKSGYYFPAGIRLASSMIRMR